MGWDLSLINRTEINLNPSHTKKKKKDRTGGWIYLPHPKFVHNGGIVRNTFDRPLVCFTYIKQIKKYKKTDMKFAFNF